MSDPRFARLKSDPRFRRPRKIQSKVVVDDRFKDIFDKGRKKTKDKKATGRNVVDKYGRLLSDTHEQDNLRRFYRLENDEEEDAALLHTVKPGPDYARGEVLMESSDESEDVEDDESDLDDVIQLGRDHSKPISVLEEDAEIDLDESNFADLDAQAAAYAKTVSGEEDDHPEAVRTRRLAVVNLDWDHVKATHLYKIFSSLVSPMAPASTVTMSGNDRKSSGSTPIVRGSVLSVRIYPSEFGKERLAREDKEGPPPEIFKKRNQDEEDDEVNAKNIYEVGDQDEYDDVALRNYQLERLRYYYAIVTCNTVDAASHIYSELDGTELERSANVLDMSFVPDNMTFGDECRDEATGDQGIIYKPLDFVTSALRHSKVALTWDDDDPERNQLTRRALTREEIEEGDFKAYIASSSSSESEVDENHHPGTEKRKNKAVSRDRLRALLLGGGDDEMPEGWSGTKTDKGDVDMEITFTPGLTEARSDWDESTLEKYQRKMKEKRKKRQETDKENGAEDVHGELGMKDDFFDVVNVEDRSEKMKKKAKNQSLPKDSSSRPLATPPELALLVSADNPDAEPKHFNMKAIIKAEKASKRKKKKKNTEDDYETQENFAINVEDERFKALHEDHTFAIDPSNPHFKKTKSMVALIHARSKIHKDTDTSSHGVGLRKIGNEQSLQSFVESVKRKSAAAQQPGSGKRRKL